MTSWPEVVISTDEEGTEGEEGAPVLQTLELDIN